MADEPPTDPQSPSAPPSADALADELLKMGSFADASADGEAPPTPDLAELEALLQQASFDAPAPPPRRSNAAESDLADRLMAEAMAGTAARGGPALPATTQFNLPAFEKAVDATHASSIDLLRDVDLNVKIELGRSRMLVEDVLKLAEGSVVELDKLAGDPVDVFVNDRLVARGEVLVLNDTFCVRVNEIVAAVRDDA